MSFIVTKTFVLDCPAAFRDEINADVAIATVCENVRVDLPDTVSIQFAGSGPLPGPEDTALDSLIAGFSCPIEVPEDEVVVSGTITDNSIVRGDGGVTNIQGSTGTGGIDWTISDDGQMIGAGDVPGDYVLTVRNLNATSGSGFRVQAGEALGDIAFSIEDSDGSFNIMELEADQGYITLGKTYAQTLLDNGIVYGIDQQNTGLASDYNTQVGTYRIGGVDVIPPEGGTAGQVLEKIDATDYNWQWADPSGGSALGSVVQARRTTQLNPIPLTFTDLDFDTTDIETDSAVIEHLNPTTADRIEVKEDGLYRIYYHITADDEVTARVRLNDTTVIPGSTQQSGDVTDANQVVVNNSVKVFANLTAGDFLTVQVLATTGSEFIFEESLFSVEKVENTPGPQGPPGTGSTVNVQDEGVAVPNGPFDTLNFTGAGVTASDAGGGVTDINIPGSADRQLLLRHNGGTTQTLTTTFVTQQYGTVVREDSVYSHSAGAITITQAGTYKVIAQVSADSTGPRSASEIRLALNGTPIVGTNAFGYHRNTAQGENTPTIAWYLEVAANDVLTVQVREISGSVVTIANACRLLIEQLEVT